MNATDPRPLAGMQQRLAAMREQLLAHPVYRKVDSLERVRVFCAHHVFAVWDFMSLLKALQRRLTSLDEVWRPIGDPDVRRLVNEIVLGEESDVVGGITRSHFELYCAAMQQIGAPTAAIDTVLERLGRGEAIGAALAAAPAPARQFVATTFEIVQGNSLPAIAAAFTVGREGVIPAMFSRFVRELHDDGHVEATLLVDYLERHIEIDGEQHGPMADRMLRTICGDDAASWHEAERAAERSLQARITLWDGVVAAFAPVPVGRDGGS